MIKEPRKFSNIEPLEVIEPYTPQIIQFENVNDFNVYYSKHKEEFDESTQKLNAKYKIPGYKLTKLKGILKIIKDYSLKTSSDESLHETFHEKQKINELQKIVNEIEKVQRELKETSNVQREQQKAICQIQSAINEIQEYLSK